MTGSVSTFLEDFTVQWAVAGGHVLTNLPDDTIVELPIQQRFDTNRLEPHILKLTPRRGSARFDYQWQWRVFICAPGDIALVGFGTVPTWIWKLLATGEHRAALTNIRLSVTEHDYFRLALIQFFSNASSGTNERGLDLAWSVVGRLPTTLGRELWDWYIKEKIQFKHTWENEAILCQTINRLATLTANIRKS